ncbi:MAG: hypothetical protein AVDCRST_MAG70-899 [uncultured Thermomicrobiales bacterium]|uniref:DUF885 domain-containing protein n=1 Tax=uncultured Thermomicrobiales bacterium TaxID=1645740 RepID=A0A6J4ULR6_9BACT|nr:MAG: hypothetical protein AVDCRST_MAG70-899 [uncultured Thermomicrobiales bacterium]
MDAVSVTTGDTRSEHDNRLAFAAWMDDFFAFDRARRPVNATFTGVHDHDHQLPDFSPEGRARAVDAMRDLRRRLAAIGHDGLDEASRHDRSLADGHLAIQLWEETAPHFHAGNPAVVTGEGIFGVLSLFLRDSEPLADRVAAAVSRMTAMPGFLEQGRANVDAAPAAWTERAAREARAADHYFGRGVQLLAAERGITDPSFLAAAETARAAFREHATWLETDLTKRTTDAYACGREAFDRYLHQGHHLPVEHDAGWVEAYAREALEAAQRALDDRARDVSPDSTCDELLGTLPDHHPTIEEYPSAFARTWHAARSAALDHDLVTWPDFPIEYVPVPASDREAAGELYYLPYRCPAPFGRPEVHRYLVPPIDPSLPAEEQERRLRATNDSVITLNHVIHHGGLGHHVQNWHAARAASRIGQVAGVDCASRIAFFCGGTLVEGWACYATDLMDEVGFLTPLQSLAQAQNQVRMAARAVVDVALHTGGLTLAEAARFYEREAGMSAAAAHGEAVKNSMFPGAAMMYLIGTDAIHDLRRQMATAEGASFSPRAFHDRFLSYGAIPVSLIAASMLGDAAGSPGVQLAPAQ